MFGREPRTMITPEFGVPDMSRKLLRDQLALLLGPLRCARGQIEPPEGSVTFLVGDNPVEHRNNGGIGCLQPPRPAELQFKPVLERGVYRHIAVEMLTGIQHASMKVAVEHALITALGGPCH